MFERDRNARAVGRAKSLRARATWSEEHLWKALRKVGVHVRRQAPIGKFVVDFAIHRFNLVIQVDGEIHERLAEVAVRDLECNAWLESQGYRVLRFTNRQISDDVWSCVEEIKKALPLDGGGLGGGGRRAPEGLEAFGVGAHSRPTYDSAATPPPNPPPSRGRA